MTSFAYIVLICIIYLALALSGMTFIKLGHNDITGISVPIVGTISTKLFLGILLYGLGFLVFVFFVSKLKVSVVIPVVSGIYCVFTVVIGLVLFGEKINIPQLIGIIMIVIGTVVVGIYKG